MILEALGRAGLKP